MASNPIRRSPATGCVLYPGDVADKQTVSLRLLTTTAVSHFSEGWALVFVQPKMDPNPYLGDEQELLGDNHTPGEFPPVRTPDLG